MQTITNKHYSYFAAAIHQKNLLSTRMHSLVIRPFLIIMEIHLGVILTSGCGLFYAHFVYDRHNLTIKDITFQYTIW